MMNTLYLLIAYLINFSRTQEAIEESQVSHPHRRCRRHYQIISFFLLLPMDTENFKSL